MNVTPVLPLALLEVDVAESVPDVFESTAALSLLLATSFLAISLAAETMVLSVTTLPLEITVTFDPTVEFTVETVELTIELISIFCACAGMAQVRDKAATTREATVLRRSKVWKRCGFAPFLLLSFRLFKPNRISHLSL
ncbi:hypothetical protein [Bifidobacterium biavatii]|uniref:hypothetical protein n=1 Tax=Bifidobacterium biavatii TaxID=762212 RepID=UPI00126A1716|nr:hypothetical protein [Bifidobacterium biavatii]